MVIGAMASSAVEVWLFQFFASGFFLKKTPKQIVKFQSASHVIVRPALQSRLYGG